MASVPAKTPPFFVLAVFCCVLVSLYLSTVLRVSLVLGLHHLHPTIPQLTAQPEQTEQPEADLHRGYMSTHPIFIHASCTTHGQLPPSSMAGYCDIVVLWYIVLYLVHQSSNCAMCGPSSIMPFYHYAILSTASLSPSPSHTIYLSIPYNLHTTVK